MENLFSATQTFELKLCGTRIGIKYSTALSLFACSTCCGPVLLFDAEVSFTINFSHSLSSSSLGRSRSSVHWAGVHVRFFFSISFHFREANRFAAGLCAGTVHWQRVQRATEQHKTLNRTSETQQSYETEQHVQNKTWHTHRDTERANHHSLLGSMQWVPSQNTVAKCPSTHANIVTGRKLTFRNLQET